MLWRQHNLDNAKRWRLAKIRQALRLRESRKEVSQSALLNFLDDVGSQEGRALIRTTNHTEHLDAALARLGRVEMKLELGYTNWDINTRLFRAMFMRDGTLPEKGFSPAEIQSFVLEQRRSPYMAVENVHEWVVWTRKGKKQIKRADFWVLQEDGEILGWFGVAH